MKTLTLLFLVFAFLAQDSHAKISPQMLLKKNPDHQHLALRNYLTKNVLSQDSVRIVLNFIFQVATEKENHELLKVFLETQFIVDEQDQLDLLSFLQKNCLEGFYLKVIRSQKLTPKAQIDLIETVQSLDVFYASSIYLELLKFQDDSDVFYHILSTLEGGEYFRLTDAYREATSDTSLELIEMLSPSYSSSENDKLFDIAMREKLGFIEQRLFLEVLEKSPYFEAQPEHSDLLRIHYAKLFLSHYTLKTAGPVHLRRAKKIIEDHSRTKLF